MLFRLISLIFLAFYPNDLFANLAEISSKIEMKSFYDDVGSLVADIISKTRPMHCYALITDEIYLNVIYRLKLFHSIERKSHFVVRLMDEI